LLLPRKTRPAGWSVTGRLLQSPDPLDGEEKLRVTRLLLERGAPLVAKEHAARSGSEGLVVQVLRWFAKLGQLGQFQFERAEATALATLQLLTDYGCTAKVRVTMQPHTPP
jgi:hypothetical protein